MTAGTLLRSGFSDGDCDCHTRCWTRRGDFLCTNRVTRGGAFSERIAMMSAAQRSITSLRYDRALSRALLARSRAHGADPARQLFPNRRRCVLLERQRKGKARVGCTLAWPCNGHWSATRVAVVGTSNNDSEVQQGSRSTRNSIRTSALGPMLDTLRAPPVPPGRDMQASENLFMDLDEKPSKRPRDTSSSSTQQFDFDNPDEFVQRTRNVSVPLPRTPEQLVPDLETPFQPVPHGNVAPETPQLSVPSTPPFQCFPGGETAPVTPRVEKLENCPTCDIILSSCLTSDAQHVCSSIHVARGFCHCALSRGSRCCTRSRSNAI